MTLRELCRVEDNQRIMKEDGVEKLMMAGMERFKEAGAAGTERGFKHGIPFQEYGRDVLLIIEVADTSVAFDTQVKAKLYSKAGIPEYWVLDVPEACLRVFTEPSAKGYKHLHVFDRGDTVKCTSVSGLAVKVKEWLP